METSPRNIALILFSIWRSGAGPLPCDSLSGSSSSSMAGASSRRGVDMWPSMCELSTDDSGGGAGAGAGGEIIGNEATRVSGMPESSVIVRRFGESQALCASSSRCFEGVKLFVFGI